MKDSMTHTGPLEGQLTLVDSEGLLHSFAVSSDALLLDGRPVIIAQWDLNQIQFADPPLGRLNHAAIVQCTPEALWYAVAGVGATPTVREAGGLLAESLARWSQWCSFSASFTHVPCLPIARLDTFTEQALARCDGTALAVGALAYLLDQSIETVVAWLSQRGIKVAEELQVPDACTSESDPVMRREHRNEGRRKLFTWSSEMVDILTQEFLAAEEQSTSASARAIADRHQWKVEAVEYKIHHLQLPARRQRQREVQTALGTEQEDDRPVSSTSI